MSTSMSSVIVGSGECWLPYIQLADQLEKTAEAPTAENLEDLEQYLTRHQGNFRTLLTTKPKNAKEREYIKTAVTEPISLRTCEAKQILPAAWVSETMLLSDILDFNEFQALDLLVTGEAEVLNYPCWARGLIAVNMYYEGWHALISSLHLMVRLSPGLTWGSRVSHKVQDVLKPFLDNLFADNLIDKILDLMPKYDVQKQMDILDSNLALGDWRHRTEILKHLTGIKVELAQIIFCFSAQRCLTWKNTLRIMEYLRHIELKRDVKFYKEHILLIFSVLYALDNSINGESFDKGYALEFRKYMLDADNKNTFLSRELLEFLNLAYYTCVYKLLADTTNDYNPASLGRPTLGKGMDTSAELLGEDELEFKTDVFSFLKIEIFTNEAAEVNEEEHIMRRIHLLFTDFITHMPMKLKDMKVRSEDAAKTAVLYLEQGLARPPNLPVEYESFLESMGAFYSLDTEGQLAECFFSSDREFFSLSKFTRSLCHDSPPLFVCNTKLMIGLGKSYPSGAFALIKLSGHNMSLDHFFESIMRYLSSFGKLANSTGQVFQSDAYQRVVLDPLKVKLSPHEVQGIVSYLQLMQGCCAEQTIKNYFANTKRHWIKLILASIKIRSLPLEVRAEMLKAVGAMIPTEVVTGGQETLASLWEIFYSARLIDPGCGDLRDELEEKETRLESYILCNGFLTLFGALVKARSVVFGGDYGVDENGGGLVREEAALLDTYVAYVRDAVLVKLAYRTYRSVPERWETTALAVSILSRLLDEVPILMVQFLSDCPVLKSVLNILVECTKVREMSTGKTPYVDKASWEVLNLVYQVVIRQDTFLRKTTKVVHGAVLHGIHDLLLGMNIVTGRTEYLIALLKFIDKFNPENHQELSLQILTAILSQHSDADTHVYAGITSDHRQSLILEYTFSQCLANSGCSIQIKKNILKLLRCSVVHAAPNLGLFLLGVDKKIDFQKHDDKTRPSRSMLHYILDNCDELPDVFLTLLVLLRDDRLREPLLEYLRSTQFFIKYYVDSFNSANMELKDTGYFLKCVSIDLKHSPLLGPLGQVLVSKDSHKFLSILDRVELMMEVPQLPLLEFFEQELVIQAMTGCEYYDRDYKVKLVELKRLEDLYEGQIQKLEKSTTLRLKKSVMGEARQLLDFARTQNELRRREASKVLLFDCWKQCLEVLILTQSTLKAAGMDFVTSVLRLVLDKITNTEGATEIFLRLGAETVLSLCGVMTTFKVDLSESMLNLILTSLCSWASTESTISVRALLYPSILNIVGIMRDQKKSITSRTNFAVIIDSICKDSLQATDMGKITSMYLLGEIIHWSMQNGYGGRVPYVDVSQPLTFGVSRRSNINDWGSKGFGQDVSIIDTPGRSPRNIPSPIRTNTPKRSSTSFVEQFNSTVLPMDVRDKQNIAPGDWQVTAKDDSFLGFVQKDTEGMQNAFEIEEVDGFKATTNFATNATIMNYMQSKGLVRNLIASITSEDDLGLLDLFTAPPGSIHLRSLLIFCARMHLLSRFARTGSSAALILLEDVLIPRLADMHVFKMASRLNLFDPRPALGDRASSIDAQIERSSIYQKATQLDTLFVSVWSMLHCMLASLPNNVQVPAQIWRFVELNKESAVLILSRYPAGNQNDEEVPEAVTLFTSLLARLGDKIPLGHAIRPRDDVFDKIMETLKEICRMETLTNSRICITNDLLQFLYGYAKNPAPLGAGDANPRAPCRPVLIACMNYKDLEGNSKDGLTLGDILFVVQSAAYRIPNWDGPPDLLSALYTICEIGFTLVYRHMEIFTRAPFPIVDSSGVSSNKKRRDPRANLQNDVARFLIDTLAKTMTDAFEDQQDSPSVDYIQSMCSRIRRLALLASGAPKVP